MSARHGSQCCRCRTGGGSGRRPATSPLGELAGLSDLTGRPDGPSLGPPPGLVAGARALAGAVGAGRGTAWERAVVASTRWPSWPSGPGWAGLRRRGAVSCGGGSRLVPVRRRLAGGHAWPVPATGNWSRLARTGRPGSTGCLAGARGGRPGPDGGRAHGRGPWVSVCPWRRWGSADRGHRATDAVASGSRRPVPACRRRRCRPGGGRPDARCGPARWSVSLLRPVRCAG